MPRLLLALALLAFSTIASARPPEQGERPTPPGQIIAENAASLGIDAETQAEIEALFAAVRPAMEAAHEDARARMEAGDEAGARAVMQAAREDGRATMDAVMAMLTEPQQQALRELLPPPPGQQGGPARR